MKIIGKVTAEHIEARKPPDPAALARGKPGVSNLKKGRSRVTNGMLLPLDCRTAEARRYKDLMEQFIQKTTVADIARALHMSPAILGTRYGESSEDEGREKDDAFPKSFSRRT